MLLQEEVRSGRLPPVQALRELIELRAPSASPLRDRNLLASFWPQGLATPGEAVQLLHLLDGDVRGTLALGLLDHALRPPHRIDHMEAWLDLCAQVRAHPVCAQLPNRHQAAPQGAAGPGQRVGRCARRDEPGGTSGYAAIEDRIEGLPNETRDLLRQYLAFLTLTVPRPTEQLVTRSEPVFAAICVQARGRLEPEPADHHLGARLFQTWYQLQGSRALRARVLEENCPSANPSALVTPRPGPGGKHLETRRHARPAPGRWSTGAAAAPRKQRLRDLSKDFKLWCKQNARAGHPGLGAVTSGGSVIARISSRLRPGPR